MFDDTATEFEDWFEAGGCIEPVLTDLVNTYADGFSARPQMKITQSEKLAVMAHIFRLLCITSFDFDQETVFETLDHADSGEECGLALQYWLHDEWNYNEMSEDEYNSIADSGDLDSRLYRRAKLIACLDADMKEAA